MAAGKVCAWISPKPEDIVGEVDTALAWADRFGVRLVDLKERVPSVSETKRSSPA
jgi:hypothetical protein